MAGPWTLRTVEWRLTQAEGERNSHLQKIEDLQRDFDWRQSAVETLNEEIEELRAVLIGGSAMPPPDSDVGGHDAEHDGSSGLGQADLSIHRPIVSTTMLTRSRSLDGGENGGPA